jgi:N-hydroxyarylamine O-acetyltransferase
MRVNQVSGAMSKGVASHDVDLDMYCTRIGYAGPRRPTLKTLRALLALQPASIPFEAIDALLDRGIDISPTAVDAKLLRGARGGYCFEQNGLLKRVLEALGFDVQGLLARVHWMASPGAALGPRTHMVLRVVVDGVPWLADAGFGGCVPTAPLRMDTSGPQATQHETFRVIPLGDGLLVQVMLDDEWASLYDFSGSVALDADYEMANWFTSTHPSSHFRQRLSVARTTPGGALCAEGQLSDHPLSGRPGLAPLSRCRTARTGIARNVSSGRGALLGPGHRACRCRSSSLRACLNAC